MSRRIPLAALMQNLQAEMDRMAMACESVGDLAGRAIMAPPDHIDRAQIMIALQGLDGLAQSLRDFARLASGMKGGRLGTICIDTELIRQQLTLVSLTERLLGLSPLNAEDSGKTELFI